MSIIKIKEIHIYYEIHGIGEPLVHITGIGNDVSDYQTIIPQFSKIYQVITFDNRGAGRTDKPNISYSIDMMADDTSQLLKALNVGQAHILGISMGGRIAVALALQHPEQVRSLILVSTSVKYTQRSLFGRLLFFVMTLPIFRIMDKYPQPRYAFIRQSEASKDYDCSDRLHEIHVPTLIIHGKKDKLVPYKSAEEIHIGIKNSKICLLNGGHLMFFWSHQCIEVIEEFLKTNKDF